MMKPDKNFKLSKTTKRILEDKTPCRVLVWDEVVIEAAINDAERVPTLSGTDLQREQENHLHL